MTENKNLKIIFNDKECLAGQSIEEGSKSIFYAETLYYILKTTYSGTLEFIYFKDNEVIETVTINQTTGEITGYTNKISDRVNIKYNNTSASDDLITLIIKEYAEVVKINVENLDLTNELLTSGISSSDSTTHTKLDTINTTLNSGINSSDTTTHTKLDTTNSRLTSVVNNTAGINSTIINKSNEEQTKLDTIDTTLNGVLDICPQLCKSLQVKTVFTTTAGTTAINILDGPVKLVAFSYAHSDNQGCLTFYDEAASATAPTNVSTYKFAVASTTATLSSPTFPTSSYINFENGLWIRLSSNIDPSNGTSEAGTITLFYEV